jgi:hypothetical protein
MQCIAEELGDKPRSRPHRPCDGDEPEAERQPECGSNRHGEKAHDDVEREALREQRSPSQHRSDDRRRAGAGLRFADAGRDGEGEEQENAVVGCEWQHVCGALRPEWPEHRQGTTGSL